MTRIAKVVALALAALGAGTAMSAGGAAAGDAAMRRPLEAASLAEGPFRMVAYYTEAAAVAGVAEGAFEVVATFAPRAGGAPTRIAMALADGDVVAFALPGRPDALYRFARTGAAVAVSERGPWAPGAAF